MFDDSLVESRGRLRSKSRRWITVGSVGLQCLVAAVIVVVPMVRPEALSVRAMSPVVMVPVLKKAPVVVQARSQVVSRVASAMVPPTVMAATRVAVLPSLWPADAAERGAGIAVPSSLVGMEVAGGGDPLGAVKTGESNVVVASPKKTGPVTVSSGVSAGLLLGEIRPVYPRLAVAARVEGVVVVGATISKAGVIESARVVSGPAMLARAALDAVKEARYRPYRLNGEVTEVQTTITVNFRLGVN